MRMLCLGLLLAFQSFGCRSIQSVSLTQIPSKREKPVVASASRLIFFAFNFDNDYVDTIVSQLKDACPKGQVRGILTKDEVTVYFPLIVHKRDVTAQGFCVQAGKQVAELELEELPL
jgi:hypothetical protein